MVLCISGVLVFGVEGGWVGVFSVGLYGFGFEVGLGTCRIDCVVFRCRV